MKKILKTLSLLLALVLTLSACGTKKEVSQETSNETSNVLKIGATPVPHVEILNFIKEDLAQEGVELEIIEFTDYVQPNVLLSDKELDANFFQHVPYLDSFVTERNLDLVSVAKVHVEPLGLYSKKFESLEDIKDGATISIPNDPTNEGRALILLDNAGIIKLKDDAGLEATEFDIAHNPKNLVFKPIEAPQLPRTLEDVDGSVINTNFALEANLNPTKDAILLEGSNSPYANIIVTRNDNKGDEKIQKLIKVIQSEKVKKFIEEKYNGAVVPAF
ncbi:MetQ/NlpA family ABC transporter substrate-binding protein [Anaeromicrobium sediminis]|uniref:Lipoprotein n=1 Tax=Anaeromicrobium sediminis TaxID=1478221 RepID=A0A267MII4_9FIRM|nr:MetQ/NlpA family ABC transporter substrate-binding protein [Anaeromicrobium sediminis]PAB59257.1 methionine ABC transporter substrate-binding protein [Anaeromicrobium sediminis]